MKAFWAVIALLIVGAVVLLVLGGEDEPRSDAPRPAAASTPATTEPELGRSPSPPPAPVQQAPKGSEDRAEIVAPLATPETQADVRELVRKPEDDEARMRDLAASPEAPAVEDVFPRPATSEPTIGAGMAVAPSPTPAPDTELAGSPTPAAPSPTPPAASSPGDTGAGKTLDTRFIIAGSGTAEDPYKVSWATLVSAQETYKPRLGQKELPERIKELDGKHVQVTGFLAFPFMAAQAQELLVMQNMWDGCCIGVPPTPYDAIEVTLAAPADGPVRFMQYGTVSGVLKVDPFVRGDWLISLYTLTGAKVTPEM